MKEHCPCQPECHQKFRRISQSTSRWPGMNYWPYLAAKYGMTYRNRSISVESFTNAILPTDGEVASTAEIEAINTLFTRLQDIVRNNFLKVKIYFSTRNIQTITESPKYNFQSLLSSLGGAFSLYLGISIIALFESLELATRLLFRTVSRMPQSRKRNLRERKLSGFDSKQINKH